MSIWHTPERESSSKDGARAFAEREILPHVQEWERTGDCLANCTAKPATPGCSARACPRWSAAGAATARMR